MRTCVHQSQLQQRPLHRQESLVNHTNSVSLAKPDPKSTLLTSLASDGEPLHLDYKPGNRCLPAVALVPRAVSGYVLQSSRCRMVLCRRLEQLLSALSSSHARYDHCRVRFRKICKAKNKLRHHFALCRCSKVAVNRPATSGIITPQQNNG